MVKCQSSLLTLPGAPVYLSGVPQKLRIQYAGAIDHVSSMRNDPRTRCAPAVWLLAALAANVVVRAAGADKAAPAWGAPTNGIRLGAHVHWVRTGTETPPICVLYLENVTTNFLYVRLPKVENRYRVGLTTGAGAPVGRPIGTLSRVSRVRFQGLSPRLPLQIDFFSLPDTFPAVTNGEYISSTSANVAVSAAPGSPWKDTVSYFSLPPVTNVFTVRSTPHGLVSDPKQR